MSGERFGNDDFHLDRPSQSWRVVATGELVSVWTAYKGGRLQWGASWGLRAIATRIGDFEADVFWNGEWLVTGPLLCEVAEGKSRTIATAMKRAARAMLKAHTVAGLAAKGRE